MDARFLSQGTTTNYGQIIWMKSKVRHVLFVPSQGMDQKTHHHFVSVQAYHHGTASPLLWTWQPNFTLIFQRPSRRTVSNALVRSTKIMVEVHVLFLAFLLKLPCCKDHVNCFFLLNPPWLSGRSPYCSRYSFSWLSRTLARTFPAIDNKEIKRCHNDYHTTEDSLSIWIGG